MKKWRGVIGYILGAVCITVFWQNCAPFEAAKLNLQSSDKSSPSPNVAVAGYYKKINSQILVPKCLSCHGTTTAASASGIDFTSYTTLITTGSVTAGQPDQSALYTTALQGTMPQGGGHLTSDELGEIRSWIANGARENETPKAVPGNDTMVMMPTATLNGSGTDVDGSIVSYAWTQISGPNTATASGANTKTLLLSNLVNGTYVFSLIVTDDEGATGTAQVKVIVSEVQSFANLSATIFKPQCTSCHNPTTLAGNFDLTTYASATRQVVPGNSAASLLYKRASDGTMAPGAPLAPASAALIKLWIDQGALNN